MMRFLNYLIRRHLSSSFYDQAALLAFVLDRRGVVQCVTGGLDVSAEARKFCFMLIQDQSILGHLTLT